MNAFVAVTDYRWFTFLANLPKLDEINFWQPGGNRAFTAIKPSELFLFKLQKPSGCHYRRWFLCTLLAASDKPGLGCFSIPAMARRPWSNFEHE